MTLSEYHVAQAGLAKERLAKQAEFKEFELREVFSRVIPVSSSVIPATRPAKPKGRSGKAGISPLKVAVHW